MGHLPFWQEYVVETNTKNYENLFEESDTAFPVGPYQFVFGSHRQNSRIGKLRLLEYGTPERGTSEHQPLYMQVVR